IHSIIDRYRTAALPFTGSSLLAARYSDVPLLSPAWGVGKIGLPLSDEMGGIKIMGMSLPFSPDTTFVASLSWEGKTKLRVEEIAPTEQAAATSADAVHNLLHLVRTVSEAAPADSPHAQTQAALRQMLDSAKIKQHKDRAIFTATIPKVLLQQLLKTPVAMQTGPEPRKAAPEPDSSGPAQKQLQKK
ncbi:MAG: hypothetical protein ACRD3F_05065, partial [Acidobacteriaceae bacterium]